MRTSRQPERTAAESPSRTRAVKSGLDASIVIALSSPGGYAPERKNDFPGPKPHPPSPCCPASSPSTRLSTAPPTHEGALRSSKLQIFARNASTAEELS